MTAPLDLDYLANRAFLLPEERDALIAEVRRLRAEVEIVRGPFVATTVQLGAVTMAGEVWAMCPGVPGNDGRCPVCGIAQTSTGMQHSRRIA